MATEDIFLKLKDIKGESVDASHKDELELHSWSWGVSNSGSSHSGTGSGTGKASFSDASFTMRMDKASVTLLQYCATGKHIPDATMVQRRAAGDKQLEFLKFEMKDLIVTSVQKSSSGQDAMIAISLNFAEFKATYTPQTATGGSGTAVDWGYNIAKNEKV